MTTPAAETKQTDQLDRSRVWFESLRDRICAEIEAIEVEAPLDLFPGEPAQFDLRARERENGMGGGVGGFLTNGRLFEKACVHTSTARGILTPEMAQTMPGAKGVEQTYASTSISLIMHPRSPKVPTVHMNTRYFHTTDYWFGGGADLTPMLNRERHQTTDDAVLFHEFMKGACDPYNPDWHAKYKAWCDEYFFLPHRKVARGVGGIFFDRHNTGDFETDFAFTQAVGEAFLSSYPKIVRRRMMEGWDAADRAEQLEVRGLYVEFNLLYDRGTTFGLRAGGNVETILSSMPPAVTWG